MFKSRIEIREFAVRQAVELLGTGSPQKDIVAKARDIEAYIIGRPICRKFTMIRKPSTVLWEVRCRCCKAYPVRKFR